MLVPIKLPYPNCQGTKIVKNGNKMNKSKITFAKPINANSSVTIIWSTKVSLRVVLMRFARIFGRGYVFHKFNHKINKKRTTDIEGNNTLLRRQIRQAIRKTCCFSKNLKKHLKAFEIVFFTSIFFGGGI